MGDITITKHEGYVEYCLRGAFDDKGLYQAFHNIWKEADYELTHTLYDLCSADLSGITSAGVKKLALMNQHLHSDAPEFPIAILGDNDLRYGIARMSATINEFRNPNIRAFRDRDEAVSWVLSEEVHPS